jgi:hypothetical protein
MSSLKELQEMLRGLQPGEVSDPAPVATLLAKCWDELPGSEAAGMSGYKLLGRMEDVRWDPPVLSFGIERHGATVLRSTWAEVQYWDVDLQKATASLTGTSRRQVLPMQPRVTKKAMTALANEMADLVESRKADDRVEWLDDREAHVIVAQLFPESEGFRDTVSGRRRRFRGILEQVMSARGWETLRPYCFLRPDEEKPRER